MVVSFVLLRFLHRLCFIMRNEKNLTTEFYDTQNNSLLLVRQ